MRSLDHFSSQQIFSCYKRVISSEWIQHSQPPSCSGVSFVKLEKLLLFNRLERTWGLWAGIHSVITLLGYTQPGAEAGRDEWQGRAAINNVFTRAMEAHRSCGQIRRCIEMCRWIDWPIGFSVEIIQINWKHGEEKAGRREIGRPMIYRPCFQEEDKMATLQLETWGGGSHPECHSTILIALAVSIDRQRISRP